MTSPQVSSGAGFIDPVKGETNRANTNPNPAADLAGGYTQTVSGGFIRVTNPNGISLGVFENQLAANARIAADRANPVGIPASAIGAATPRLTAAQILPVAPVVL